ncbi:MAG: hypothetical protein HYR88_01015 [Verrucomicrobia bacterium]|nr:hypothetical protein [Verrucomicrobiota bacterium]MBI3868852.1 hypothetical protein [Verrucomicrobiota bacterium]
MGARAEISWARRDESGEKIQVYAHHVGNRWDFFIRQRRFDMWQPHLEPPLEDWLELLDGVTRRAQRRLQRPEEVDHVKKMIRERFPEAELD